jgi:WD40 repeat protein
MVVAIHDAQRPEAPELVASPHIMQSIIAEWHPGGRWLAVLDMGNGVQWMDAETGKLGLIGRHKASAARATFSPDGDWLFTGGWERELICWDARGRRRSFGISLDSSYFQISADGRRCAVTTRTHLQLYVLDRPVAHREFEEDLGGLLRQAEFSLDGRWLAASAGERVGVWDLAGGGPGAVSEHGSNTRLFFTPDGGELFASRKPEGTPAAFRWRVSPATNPATAPPVLTRRPLRHPTGFTSLAMMSNLVVMTTTNGTQILAPDELETGASRWARTIAGITDVSPDRRWLGIYRSYGTELHIHQLPGLEPVARLKQSGIFGDFQFSPAGDEVAVCSTRLNRIDMWSTTTWERTRTLTNFGRLIYAPDGRGLWLSKDQRTAGLYDARTFKPLLLLPTGTLPLAVSPDERHLAVSVDAQRLQLWNLGAVREEFVRLGLDWEVR